MSKSLPIDHFLEKAKDIQVVDVRAPNEFAQGHIPGALNLPLFDNNERAGVGTRYKQKGRIPAIQLGLEIVAPKMRQFTDFALQLKSRELLLYCWRGGMRSASMAWLFETIDIKCFTLENGYKSFRNHVLSSFLNPIRLVLLGGCTGGGKTEILHALHHHGHQVLDLELCANHKGSAFGGIGQDPQPSTEQFENLIATRFAQIDPTQPLWIEDESRNVGRCSIPIALWEQMRRAPIIHVQTSRDQRTHRLMLEYAGFDTESLCLAIHKIEKRLGYDRCKEAYQACLNGARQTALEICLDYYDKAYVNQLVERFGPKWEQILPCFTPCFPLNPEQIKTLTSILSQHLDHFSKHETHTI